MLLHPLRSSCSYQLALLVHSNYSLNLSWRTSFFIPSPYQSLRSSSPRSTSSCAMSSSPRPQRLQTSPSGTVHGHGTVLSSPIDVASQRSAFAFASPPASSLNHAQLSLGSHKALSCFPFQTSCARTSNSALTGLGRCTTYTSSAIIVTAYHCCTHFVVHLSFFMSKKLSCRLSGIC